MFDFFLPFAFLPFAFMNDRQKYFSIVVHQYDPECHP